jgi:hypothetical protein
MAPIASHGGEMNALSSRIQGAPPLGAAEPVLYRGFIADGMICSDASFADISRHLFDGAIVVLKGVFDWISAISFRRAVHSWGRTTSPFPHGKSPSLFPELNYHRIDDGSYPSTIPHIFHQYGFSRIEALDEPLRGMAQRFGFLLANLQNKVSGASLKLSPDGLRMKILHYPAGGGFLAEHSHEIEPQRIGVIASLSAKGEEIEHGGTLFSTPLGKVDVAPCHEIGDVVLFRIDIPHGIPPVDPDKKLDWSSEAGKWSVVLDLREVMSRSNVT